MPLTLAQIKASSIANIAGVTTDSAEFLAYVNEAIQRLMNKGDFFATVVRAQFAVSECLVTWPSWVDTVLAINKNCSQVPLRNHWYEFLPNNAACPCDCNTWVSTDAGLSPVFNNIPGGQTNPIKVWCRSVLDVGKTITFYGVDVNGWDAHETVTLPLSGVYATTVNSYQHIYRVSKDVTVGIVDVYQTDSSGNVLDMAHYYGFETEPMYRQTRLNGVCSTCTNNVDALIKIAFVPMTADTDVSQLSNIGAIKMMVQAIKLEEANDTDASLKMEMRAIHELNQELASKLPDSQISIENSVFGGGVSFSNQTF